MGKQIFADNFEILTGIQNLQAYILSLFLSLYIYTYITKRIKASRLAFECWLYL